MGGARRLQLNTLGALRKAEMSASTCVRMAVCVYRAIMIDTCVSETANSAAKDEDSSLCLKDVKSLLHLEAAWVDGRCASNTQNLSLQKKEQHNIPIFLVSLTF